MKLSILSHEHYQHHFHFLFSTLQTHACWLSTTTVQTWYDWKRHSSSNIVAVCVLTQLASSVWSDILPLVNTRKGWHSHYWEEKMFKKLCDCFLLCITDGFLKKNATTFIGYLKREGCLPHLSSSEPSNTFSSQFHHKFSCLFYKVQQCASIAWRNFKLGLIYLLSVKCCMERMQQRLPAAFEPGRVSWWSHPRPLIYSGTLWLTSMLHYKAVLCSNNFYIF